MFTSKINYKYTKTLIKKKRYYAILFSANLIVDAAQLVLQYSAPTLSMIIEDYHLTQCQVSYKLLIVN